MNKRYVIELTDPERAELLALTRKGTQRARKCRRAQILLLADEGQTDCQIAAALHAGVATVERLRKRCVEEGLEAALNDKPRPGRERKLDGKQEAFLVALACSPPPEGHAKWSMQLLADEMVALDMVAALSDETVRRRLKETNCSRGASRAGVSRR
jgi:transposase